MRRRQRIVAGAVLAAALAGCGGEDTGGFAGANTQAQLRQLLSKELRLPDGFTARPGQAWRMPFVPKNRNCRVLLEPAGGRPPRQALTAQAAVSYRGYGLGEQAAVGLARYAGEEAAEHLDALAGARDSCRKVLAPPGTRLRVRELPVEDTGDEAVGARLEGQLNGYPYALDVVLARVGDTLVSVVHTGMTGVDEGRTRQVVAAVLAMATA
jgi:hypothetical protein